MTIHQYALKFRTLAAASGWNEPSLITAFRQGLNPRLKSHLAAYDDTHGLEKFIQLAIRCSNRINIRPTDSTPAPAIVTPPNHQPEARDQPEAMLTDMFRLTPAERRRRLTRGLCLYCGGEDHRIQTCILRPPRLWVSGIQPCIYIYVCVCVCMCIHMYMYVCVYVYIYIYMCMCVCECILCVCVCVCVTFCVCCVYVWYMSQNGQALPRINYHDPPHLTLITRTCTSSPLPITTLIRAPVSVHSVVRSCGSYKDRYATESST